MGKQNFGKYDPDDVFVDVAFQPIQGFAEEEMVRTERDDENELSVKTGAQGDFSFQANQNKSGTIIITLKQLSPSNVFLTSLKEAQSIFAVSIRSKHNYTELVTGAQCAIKVAPRVTMGKEEQDYEWQIAVGQLIETAK